MACCNDCRCGFVILDEEWIWWADNTGPERPGFNYWWGIYLWSTVIYWGFVLLLTGDLGAFPFWWIPEKELLKEMIKRKVFYLYLAHNEVIWDTLLGWKQHYFYIQKVCCSGYLLLINYCWFWLKHIFIFFSF